MPRFNIYEIKPNGTADLISGPCAYANPTEALETRRALFPNLYQQGRKYIVLEERVNPRGAQVVFTFERADNPLRVVASGL